MFFPGQFILSQSSPPVRNATYLRTFFFRIYFCLLREFVNQHVFWLFDLHWDSPKLPWGMQRICGPFVLKTITGLSILLSRDSLSCHTRSLDLCLYFYTFDTFRPILAFFTHFTLHQFFLVYITTRNIFLIPVARNLIIIFNFSSQRPHLNYIFLSKVYSFATMEFSKKHKC